MELWLCMEALVVAPRWHDNSGFPDILGVSNRTGMNGFIHLTATEGFGNLVLSILWAVVEAPFARNGALSSGRALPCLPLPPLPQSQLPPIRSPDCAGLPRKSSTTPTQPQSVAQHGTIFFVTSASMNGRRFMDRGLLIQAIMFTPIQNGLAASLKSLRSWQTARRSSVKSFFVTPVAGVAPAGLSCFTPCVTWGGVDVLHLA